MRGISRVRVWATLHYGILRNNIWGVGQYIYDFFYFPYKIVNFIRLVLRYLWADLNDFYSTSDILWIFRYSFILSDFSNHEFMCNNGKMFFHTFEKQWHSLENGGIALGQFVDSDMLNKFASGCFCVGLSSIINWDLTY